MEEIIIDGVNVAGCGYFCEDECNICGMGTDGEDTFCKYCKDNPNCYYKQLKRLEQENARLKEEKERLRDNIKSISRPVLLPDVPIEVTNKYKQTLQEIKAIAENAYCLTNYTNKDMANFAKQILVTITKAEEE